MMRIEFEASNKKGGKPFVSGQIAVRKPRGVSDNALRKIMFGAADDICKQLQFREFRTTHTIGEEEDPI